MDVSVRGNYALPPEMGEHLTPHAKLTRFFDDGLKSTCALLKNTCVHTTLVLSITLLFMISPPRLSLRETTGRLRITRTSTSSKVYKDENKALAESLKSLNGFHFPLPPLHGRKAYHKIRKDIPKDVDEKSLFTWEHNYNIITSAGHPWCSILRDNHACFGPTYHESLRFTRPYDASKYGIQHLPRGSKVLAEGNSHTMELMYLPMCAAGVLGHGYHYKGNSHYLMINDVGTNENLTHMKSTSTSALVLSNDPYFAGSRSSSSRTVEFLKNSSWHPTHIVLGKINGNGESCSKRALLYRASFPDAKIVCRCSRRGAIATGIADMCGSDFQDCRGYIGGGHQCVPSRGVIRGAEELMREWLGEIETFDICKDAS